MKTFDLLLQLLERPTVEFFLALGLAMIAHEIINVQAAAHRYGTIPSFRRYFGDPANQWQITLNVVTAAIGFLARHEIMTLAAAQNYPILTGAGLGACSAFLFDKLVDITKRRVASTTETLNDENPEG